ncbi:MAG: hypothetical protein ACI4IQ_07250 [Eubacterium sp.]
MKKKYSAPELYVEKFLLPNSVITTSGGLEDGDTDIPIDGGEF